MKPEPVVLQGEPLRVYRTLPARVIGWSMVVAALALTVLTVVDLARGHQAQVLAPVALIAGVAAAAWVLFLRPAVRLHADGLVVTNVLTETTVPFAAVDEVGHRWALEVRDASGRTHSAWAVPVRRDMVRRRGIDDFAETTRRRGHEGVTAQGVTDEVLRTMQRWRLDGGEPGGDPPPVVRRVSWSAVAVLVVAAALGLGVVLL